MPGPEPEIAAKKVQEKIVTIPRLPGTCPKAWRKMRMMSSVIPPRSMMLPARMNPGIARSGNLSSPFSTFCVAKTSGASVR